MKHSSRTAERVSLLQSGNADDLKQALQGLLTCNELQFKDKVEVIREASRTNGSLDIQIAQYVVEQSEAGMPVRDSLYLLEMLNRAIPELTRVSSILAPLLSSREPRITSKLIVMLGGKSGTAESLRQHLHNPDDRVRANAVESARLVPSKQSLEVLKIATADHNNRVVGNALLALYRLGNTDVIEAVKKMSSHSAPAFRATAAWVMGEIADVCFCGTLNDMVRNDSGSPRLNAIRALTRIKVRSSAG